MEENLFNKLTASIQECNSLEDATQEEEVLEGDIIQATKQQAMFKSLSAALDYANWTQPSSLAINAVRLNDGTSIWVMDYMNTKGKAV